MSISAISPETDLIGELFVLVEHNVLSSFIYNESVCARHLVTDNVSDTSTNRYRFIILIVFKLFSEGI